MIAMVPDRFYEAADNITELSDGLNPKHCDKTYNLQNMKNKIDGKEAVSQAVVKILGTERFKYPVYSGGYGIETEDLFGCDCDYVCVELERRISEALTADERVVSVDGFEFDVSRNAVSATFTVHTVFGEFEAEREFWYGNVR